MNNYKERDKAFFTWLRSALRSASRRWPAIYKALAAAKKPYKGENKRKKWLYTCAKCGHDFDGKSVAVDHIVPAGTLLTMDDVALFIDNLFCEEKDLQVLCKECHATKTVMERKGISEEEALLEQKLSVFKKKKAVEQKEILLTLGSEACNITTVVKRVDAYRACLKEKANAEV